MFKYLVNPLTTGLFIGGLSGFALTYLKKPTSHDELMITIKKTSSILIERVFDNSENDLADAMLDFITNYDGSKYIEYRKFYIVTHPEDFLLATHKNGEIYCKIKNHTIDNKNLSIFNISFELYSYSLALSDLRKYVSEITENYKIKKLNKLGDKIFYFDEVMQPLPLDIDGNVQYGSAMKYLKFNMSVFHTNKTLDNMFGPDIALVITRLKWFLENKSWYETKGIPYTFGLLITGEPGCGKTSIVKAIANMTKRHPFNIKFHDYLTQTQINNLFFNDRVNLNDGADSYIIPQDKRIYSIEEADCMSDLLLDRKQQNVVEIDNDPFASLETNMIADNQHSRSRDLIKKLNHSKSNTEKLTLGFILDAIDGLKEVPGRIIVMTTNYLERLDKALIRPGRIDLILDFKKTTRKTIIDMYKHFFDLRDEQVDLTKFEILKDYQYSPAEINQIFFKNIGYPCKALDELTDL